MKNKPILRSVLVSLVLAVIAPLVVFPALSIETFTFMSYLLLSLVFFLVALIATLATGGWGEITSSQSKPRSSLGVLSSADIGKQETGIVKWFDAHRGYGFILRDSGPEIFVHYRSIQGEGHRVLYEGQRVSFIIARGRKGLQAENVDVIAA